jgi:large subunit ribosomal protein L30
LLSAQQGNSGDKSNSDSINSIVSEILKNDSFLTKIGGIKPWFALNPPKGGFKKKSKLLHSQNGILGDNKELVDIVRRMM